MKAVASAGRWSASWVPLNIACLTSVHHRRWPLATWRNLYGRSGLPISTALASAYSLCSWCWRARAFPRSWCSPATVWPWWSEGISGAIALAGSYAFCTDPGLWAIGEGGYHDSFVHSNLCFNAERVVFPDTLLRASEGATCFDQAAFYICCSSGIIGDDASKVSEGVHCIQLVQLVTVDVDTGWVVGVTRGFLTHDFCFLEADG